GIENVNLGPIDTPQGRTWQPYPPAQVDALIRLSKDIVSRYGIPPTRVVGHSDIAPQRKTDPGPAFPWEKLAQAGIGRWYDANTVARFSASLAQTGLPDVLWFQRELARVGYGVPQHGQLDRATINVLAAFQMHYRPARYDGQPDIETAAILSALQ
ncbi:MAG: N-acetylmuramoyl-L-alanine amidase, partial [Achromobacter sp.]